MDLSYGFSWISWIFSWIYLMLSSASNRDGFETISCLKIILKKVKLSQWLCRFQANVDIVYKQLHLKLVFSLFNGVKFEKVRHLKFKIIVIKFEFNSLHLPPSK